MLNIVNILSTLGLLLATPVLARESQYTLEYGKAHRQYSRRIVELEQTTGKPVTKEQVQAIHKEVFAKVDEAWKSDMRAMMSGVASVGRSLLDELKHRKSEPQKVADQKTPSAAAPAAANGVQRGPAATRDARATDGTVLPGAAESVSFSAPSVAAGADNVTFGSKKTNKK